MIIVVDFNLIFYNFFIIGNVEYPASAKLQLASILNVSSNVIQVGTSYGHMFQYLSPYKVISISWYFLIRQSVLTVVGSSNQEQAFTSFPQTVQF